MSHINIKEISADDEVGRIVHDELTGPFQSPYVTLDEDGTCLPDRYALYANSIENFEVRNEDVWVCTFPRSGTTWTQEMVWLIANDLNYEKAKVCLQERFSYLEYNILFDVEKMYNTLGLQLSEYDRNRIEVVKNRKGARFIKSHLPFPLLPLQIRNGSKTPKIIYVTRNPKDVCVSLYHLYLLFLGAQTTIENFTKAFMAGKVIYGSLWKHVFGFWEKRHLDNLLFIKYEDMKKDHPSVIRRVASFFNKNLTDDEVKGLQRHLSFDIMKNNTSVNADGLVKAITKKKLASEDETFIRSGGVGKHKDEMSAETVNKLNEWIKENIHGTVLEHEYINYCM